MSHDSVRTVRSVFVYATIALCACTSAGHDDAAPPIAPVQPAPKPVDGPKVYLTGDKGDVAVAVEVVATEAKVERGLMYRQHLPPDDGMLFLLGETKQWKFWMRNTLIPLDMIFIRSDLTIAGIVQNAEPKTDTLREVDEPSLYVLEVNAGWTAAHGIKQNGKVRFDHVQ
jgi:uncharacterized membrane protein (UPF0127 family)